MLTPVCVIGLQARLEVLPWDLGVPPRGPHHHPDQALVDLQMLRQPHGSERATSSVRPAGCQEGKPGRCDVTKAILDRDLPRCLRQDPQAVASSSRGGTGEAWGLTYVLPARVDRDLLRQSPPG